MTRRLGKVFIGGRCFTVDQFSGMYTQCEDTQDIDEV